MKEPQAGLDLTTSPSQEGRAVGLADETVTFPNECDFWTVDQWKAVARRYHTEWREVAQRLREMETQTFEAQTLEVGLNNWIKIWRGRAESVERRVAELEKAHKRALEEVFRLAAKLAKYEGSPMHLNARKEGTIPR